jgi:hypothetical protein
MAAYLALLCLIAFFIYAVVAMIGVVKRDDSVFFMGFGMATFSAILFFIFRLVG